MKVMGLCTLSQNGAAGSRIGARWITGAPEGGALVVFLMKGRRFLIKDAGVRWAAGEKR